MDGQRSQAKLTRSNSSLLRSSPTIRSSIHSLSSVSEITPDQETEDLEEQKPHNKPSTPPVRSGSARFATVISVLLLSAYTLFAFCNWDDLSTSENLLLALIFVAGLLFFVSKNKALLSENFNFCKQLYDEYGKRFGLSCLLPKNHSKTVQWFIGDSNFNNMERKQQNNKESGIRNIVLEGVEFYSNGDFYEGEFHKGKCNGSGVYNYMVNGRYEGDWVDGDTFAGEWCSGQSHGIGIQTCADGSCYIGEFKCGVKHGLGCYHFRNRDRYAGEYFGDKVHGFGVYHFANGHCYEGSWHEGRKQGYGMYTFRNGEMRCGEWHGGNLKTPLSPLTDAVLQAVQAARRTAENAIHLRRVDEKVDKAVTAANRAATAARVAAVKAVQNRIHGKFCDTNI
ncbi:UNVERIFIED_CONTAM: hypothetical protein Sangu_1954300 [Sesamum angustifolium]|uniref:Uncharacterized protein n=1 Tax=Sesamum angustifolium TaxID=2727405 RepID=A0AAW2LXU8_9LAMI